MKRTRGTSSRRGAQTRLVSQKLASTATTSKLTGQSTSSTSTTRNPIGRYLGLPHPPPPAEEVEVLLPPPRQQAEARRPPQPAHSLSRPIWVIQPQRTALDLTTRPTRSDYQPKRFRFISKIM